MDFNRIGINDTHIYGSLFINTRMVIDMNNMIVHSIECEVYDNEGHKVVFNGTYEECYNYILNLNKGVENVVNAIARGPVTPYEFGFEAGLNQSNDPNPWQVDTIEWDDWNMGYKDGLHEHESEDNPRED